MPRKFQGFWRIAFLGVCSLNGFSAQKKVEVINPKPAEESRTALHLRLSIEELRLARKLLDQLTQLVLDSDLDQGFPIAELPRLWQEIDPLQTKVQARRVLEDLEIRAREADSAPEYQFFTNLTNSYLPVVFSQIDDRLEFMRNWPVWQGQPDPDPLRQAILEQLELQAFEGLIAEDPLAARQKLSDLDGSARFAASSNLLGTYLTAGEFDAARELGEEMIADFAARGDWEPGDLYQLQSMLHFGRNGLPDVARRALDLLLDVVLSDPRVTGMRDIELESDHGSGDFSGNESYLMGVLRSLGSDSHLTKVLLERVPSFASKVELLGGISYARKARERRTRSPVPEGIPGSELSAVQPLAYAWGEASERPEAVRKRLRRGLEDLRNGISGVISLVLANCVRDPEFAFLAEQEIERKLRAAETTDQGIPYWRMLISIYRNCERKVPQEVVERGRDMLAALRLEESRAKGEIGDTSSSSRVEHLESEVWAAWVWVDQVEAMQTLEKIPDPAQRARLMLGALSSVQPH